MLTARKGSLAGVHNVFLLLVTMVQNKNIGIHRYNETELDWPGNGNPVQQPMILQIQDSSVASKWLEPG